MVNSFNVSAAYQFPLPSLDEQANLAERHGIETRRPSYTPILVLDQHKLARVVSDVNPCHL